MKNIVYILKQKLSIEIIWNILYYTTTSATPLASTGYLFEETDGVWENSLKPTQDLNLKIEWSKLLWAMRSLLKKDF